MNQNNERMEMEFQPTMYNVYARVDSKNRVTKIFSDCFEQPTDNDVWLKSGSGDEFVHVGYYQIMNEDGSYRYKIWNGELAERTQSDRREELDLADISTRINELKKKLTDTDYIAIKFAEGWITEREYLEIKEQRQGWRDEINLLETEQANLSE